MFYISPFTAQQSQADSVEAREEKWYVMGRRGISESCQKVSEK